MFSLPIQPLALERNRAFLRSIFAPFGMRRSRQSLDVKIGGASLPHQVSGEWPTRALVTTFEKQNNNLATFDGSRAGALIPLASAGRVHLAGNTE